MSKKWGPSRTLTRADRGHGETRITEPPVGVPDKRNVKDVKTVNVGNDKVFDGGKKPTKVPPPEIKSSLNNAPAKLLPKPVAKPADLGKQKESDLAPQVPSEPQQKLAPPTKKSKAAAEPIQKSETPAKPIPQAQAPLRGDSQAAK